MTLTQKTESLAARLTAEAEARARAEVHAATAKLALAQLWDAAGYPGTAEPHFLHATDPARHYARSSGSLHFKALAADDALALLEHFPPVALAFMRDGNTSTVRPADCLGDRYTIAGHSDDGVLLHLEGGHGYGQSLKVEWYTERDGLRVELCAELRPSHGYLPRIVPGRTVTAAGEFLRYEGADSIHWPDKVPATAGAFVRYARGSGNALQHFVFYCGVRAWLAAVVAVQDADGRETAAAYAAALATVPEAPRLATDAEKAAHAGAYEREKLHAGTLTQAATLVTGTAAAWRALAEEHWPRFAEAHGLTNPYRDYFDHHSWAYWYLETAGALADPETGYKYGSAWL